MEFAIRLTLHFQGEQRTEQCLPPSRPVAHNDTTTRRHKTKATLLSLLFQSIALARHHYRMALLVTSALVMCTSLELILNLITAGGPILALLYAVAVLCIRAGTKECPWNAMTKEILLRSVIATAIYYAAAAGSISMIDLGTNNNGVCTVESQSLLPLGTWTVVKQTRILVGGVLASLLSIGMSIYLIRQTRFYDVQGGAPPTFQTKCMQNTVVMVTGANAGIGKETCRQLVALGATVIFACRSERRAKDAMHDIAQSFPDSTPETKKQLYFLPLDLSSLESVRNAVERFHQFKLPLHILINNAGVMMSDRYTTKDGYELTMQANHLGHFLLTKLLLPKLLEHQQLQNPGQLHINGGRRLPRVITVASCTYHLCKQGILLDDLCCSHRKYSLFGQYAQTKLANILFAKELARRYPSILSFALHPGLVRTDVVRNMPWYLKYGNIIFGSIMATLQKNPTQGAYTSVWAAASSSSDNSINRNNGNMLPPSGSYLMNWKDHATSGDISDNMEDAEKLWNLSEKLVGSGPPVGTHRTPTQNKKGD